MEREPHVKEDAINRLPIVLAVFCCVACSGQRVDRPQQADRPANSEPSLAETRSWIEHTLPALARSFIQYQPDKSGYSPGFMVDSTKTATLDSACILRVETVFSSNTVQSGQSRSRHLERIPLRSIDLNSVRVKRHEDPPGNFALEPYFTVELSVVGEDTLIENGLTD
jgi:hypothetical protein